LALAEARSAKPSGRSLNLESHLNQIRVEPALVSPVATTPVIPEQRPASASHFLTDAVSGEELIGGEEAIAQVSELLAHGGTQTPLTVGLFGGPGSGKTHVLARLVARVEALARAAGSLAGSPFLAGVTTLRISAANLKDEPLTGLATALYERLTGPSANAGTMNLARDALHASTDPRAAARDAAEQLDEARRRLDAERKTLQDLDGRRARLTETVLYEAAGSRVDAYARSNRTRIEPRLRSFGFSGEPVQTYKDLVRDYTEGSGGLGRVTTFLRALWAYQGQTALIVWAILFFLAAWGLGIATETRATWIPALRGSAETMAPVANWIEAHIAWLATLRSGALIAAVLCLLVDLWRAIRFLSPIMRGASLLRLDAEARGRELDEQVSHQTRRVDMLSAEMDGASKRLAEAERRSREAGDTAHGAQDLPFAKSSAGEAERQAQAFLAALARGLRAQRGGTSRLVVALDDLELVSPAAATQLLETAQRVLARPNIMLVFAADPSHLATAWGSTSASATHLERLVQIPLCIDAASDYDSLRHFARGLLVPTGEAQPLTVDANHSGLDEPLDANETELLATLAPLAGTSPRAVKRFLNIYRLARPRTGERAALALMLALDLGGTSGELAALGAAMDDRAPESETQILPGEQRLVEAVQAVSAARGHALTVGAAQAAWQIARDYRIPL
jgi:hypothetical protein